jgi:hypothetical protein
MVDSESPVATSVVPDVDGEVDSDVDGEFDADGDGGADDDRSLSSFRALQPINATLRAQASTVQKKEFLTRSSLTVLPLSSTFEPFRSIPSFSILIYVCERSDPKEVRTRPVPTICDSILSAKKLG